VQSEVTLIRIPLNGMRGRGFSPKPGLIAGSKKGPAFFKILSKFYFALNRG
jgi:hypothetical protein